MKKLLFLLAIPAIAFLASCGGGDGTDAPVPTITFETGSGLISADSDLEIDSDLAFKLVCVSNDKKLKNVSMSLSTNGGASGKLKDSAVSAKTATVSFDSKATGKVGDVLKYTFTVTDDNGQTASKSVSINIIPKDANLNLQSAQRVNNLIGPDPGAYDLNTSVNKVSTDPTYLKDLLDLTSTTTFAKSWGSGHGLTKFAKVTLNDFTITASTNQLFNLWKANASNATSTIANIAKDDVYVVKSNQDGVDYDYYLIKITNVVDGSGNNDYIEFSYLKK